MNFSIKTNAPNPLGLSPRVLAIVGYAFELELTSPAIDNARADESSVGVLATIIDGIEVPMATVDEIEEVLQRAATMLRLGPADTSAVTQMFFDKLYQHQHSREEVICL